jgi:hypothetical protein
VASKGGEWREALPLFEVRYRALYTPRNHREYSYYLYILSRHDRKVGLLSHRTVPNEAGDHRAARTPPCALAEGGSFATPYERTRVSRSRGEVSSDLT